MTAEAVLSELLQDAPDAIGAVLGTRDGELRAVVGRVADPAGGASTVAALTGSLAAIGALLGLGDLGVAALRSPSASRLVARQGAAVLAIELEPKRPLGGIETRLRTTPWAPPDAVLDGPAISRASTVPREGRVTGSTQPPPVPPARAARPPASVTSSLLRAGSPHTRPTRPPPLPGIAAPTSTLTGQVFAGDLEELSVPDLLEFLRSGHHSGLLTCSHVTGTGTVQLSRGMIVSADSPRALDLREHFLARSDLAPESRRALAALPAECFGETTIVDELPARAKVPRGEVERARVARIYSALREMVGWTSGRFAFDHGVASPADPALALNAQSMLMRICQERDEQGP